MKFIKSNEMKQGMRTAKPIYNREGVLLYVRNTLINENVLQKIQKLNIYGMYILEPTEPLPPVSQEDEEFERFQTVMCYELKKELDALVAKRPFSIDCISSEIIKKYGNSKRKINYLQTIRSNEDYPYKHCLSVAMLCAIICSGLNIDEKEKEYIVSSALIHDIGKLIAPPEIINKTGELSRDELRIVRDAELMGYQMINKNYLIPSGIRRYIKQVEVERKNKMFQYSNAEQKLIVGTKIIKVADLFDLLTAMRVYKDPMSGFSAIRLLQEKEDEYDEEIVTTLARGIYILPVGACVELTNGEKGLILEESEYFLLRPKVLGFKSNTIYDLSQQKTYEKVQIKDILKTMDNRFVMSDERIHAQ